MALFEGSCHSVITIHAQSRAQQRSIAPFALELLERFGSVVRHHGADVLYLDKRARRKIETYIGHSTYKRLEKTLNCYAVISDEGRFVTFAHRVKRLKRP